MLSAMVRWRCSLLLAVLLLLPARIGGEVDEDDEEENDNNGDDDGDQNEKEEDDDSEDVVEKSDSDIHRRLSPVEVPTPKAMSITRTTAKRPLECYVCAYKIKSPIKSCLDPTKHRVHTMTCHNMEDKCFTTAMNKNGALEGLVRGCRSGCVASPDTTCCELSRCNNQAFAMPMISQRMTASKTTKCIPTTVLFFVTILLVLQTVVKVAIV